MQTKMLGFLRKSFTRCVLDGNEAHNTREEKKTKQTNYKKLRIYYFRLQCLECKFASVPFYGGCHQTIIVFINISIWQCSRIYLCTSSSDLYRRNISFSFRSKCSSWPKCIKSHRVSYFVISLLIVITKWNNIHNA